MSNARPSWWPKNPYSKEAGFPCKYVGRTRTTGEDLYNAFDEGAAAMASTLAAQHRVRGEWVSGLDDTVNRKERAFPARAYSVADKDAVLAELATAWQQVPDLRLGQLLANTACEQVCREDVETWLFYVEDEVLADAVSQFCQAYGTRATNTE